LPQPQASPISTSTIPPEPAITAQSIRGPWNEGADWVYTESPALQGEPSSPSIVAESSPPDDAAGLQELLVKELRDLLHAEKQLTKALPKMAEAARFDQLRELFEIHLGEMQQQVERLNKCFDLLGENNRAKPCKGMQGLVEEGDEVMEENSGKEDAAADLALTGAAQRVEHYEIAAYTGARNLASQLRHSAVVASFQNPWPKKKIPTSC
jgi:Mn-containing catalase